MDLSLTPAASSGRQMGVPAAQARGAPSPNAGPDKPKAGPETKPNREPTPGRELDRKPNATEPKLDRTESEEGRHAVPRTSNADFGVIADVVTLRWADAVPGVPLPSADIEDPATGTPVPAPDGGLPTPTPERPTPYREVAWPLPVPRPAAEAEEPERPQPVPRISADPIREPAPHAGPGGPVGEPIILLPRLPRTHAAPPPPAPAVPPRASDESTVELRPTPSSRPSPASIFAPPSHGTPPRESAEVPGPRPAGIPITPEQEADLNPRTAIVDLDRPQPSAPPRAAAGAKGPEISRDDRTEGVAPREEAIPRPAARPAAPEPDRPVTSREAVPRTSSDSTPSPRPPVTETMRDDAPRPEAAARTLTPPGARDESERETPAPRTGRPDGEIPSPTAIARPRKAVLSPETPWPSVEGRKRTLEHADETRSRVDGAPSVRSSDPKAEPAPAIGSARTAEIADRPAPRPPVEIRDVARQIVERIEALAAQRGGTVRVQLEPEHLGTITLTVRSFGNKVDTEITASHPDVRVALHEGRQALAQAVESRGLSLNHLGIGSSPAQDGQGFRQASPEAQEHYRRLAHLTAAVMTAPAPTTSAFSAFRATGVDLVA